jgi:hypothetical protein
MERLTVKIIRENSSFRIIWDSFILIILFVSCILIPFQVAFQHDSTGFTTVILYVIDLLFFVDIYFNFLTSYRHQGMEVTDREKTSNHYLKTFFVIDLMANLPLDMLFLANQDVQIYNISLVVFLRLFRLLRFVRMFVIFRRWEELSWTNSGYLRLIKFFAIVTLITHWIACSWFLTAFIDDFPTESWVVVEGIENADLTTQYIRSIYWTIVTMTTVGYGDITPGRNIEYIFTSLAMVLGASMYAYIIGNIASLVSNLDSAKASFWNKAEAVTQYLHYRHVPTELNDQVRSYYEYVWARHRGLEEESFFADLPIPLRLEVLLHVTKDLLEKVPLFKYCSPSLRNELLIALKAQTYTPSSYITREGEIGKEIYFISRGMVEITSNGDKNHYGTLEDGDYFGNISLILEEKRTASVRTLTYCETFVLTKVEFDRIKNEYVEFKDVLKKMSSEKTEKITELMLEGVVL